jgi:hypothetical protein
VAHSIEVPFEIIRKWQEIVNLVAEIMHVPSASIMRVDPPHIKVFVSSTSEGNPCEPGALDTGPYCETVMKTGQPLLIPDALENEAWKAALLYEPPFTGVAPTGPEHLFDESNVVRLFTKIRAINDSAVA